jgi:hypothetical protein
MPKFLFMTVFGAENPCPRQMKRASSPAVFNF